MIGIRNKELNKAVSLTSRSKIKRRERQKHNHKIIIVAAVNYTNVYHYLFEMFFKYISLFYIRMNF